MKKTILIMDDEEDIRTTFQQLLKKEGYTTMLAGSLEEFIQAIGKKPNLILLDIMIPGTTTDELLRLLNGYAEVKVIIFSVLQLSGQDKKKISAYPQVVGFLQKPVEKEAFLKTIRTALSS